MIPGGEDGFSGIGIGGFVMRLGRMEDLRLGAYLKGGIL